MGKYLQILKATWAEYMVYRLNFLFWRLRQVMQILVVYFLWWSIFAQQDELFGYSQSMILTYVLLSSIVRTIVLATTTMEVGNMINRGELSNFLLRPMSVFRYFFARDAADKGLNLLFSVFEISMLYLVLRPQIFIQTSPHLMLLTVAALLMGAWLYFNFSLLLGFIGFWSPDVWAPRFLSFVIMEFFAGGLFPLDILPRPLYIISQSLPFYYFIFFPIRVYLGQMSPGQLVFGFVVGALWITGLGYLAKLVWRQGLKVYSAEGR
jgi:ABC-2 type transport system permease protein